MYNTISNIQSSQFLYREVLVWGPKIKQVMLAIQQLRDQEIREKQKLAVVVYIKAKTQDMLDEIIANIDFFRADLVGVKIEDKCFISTFIKACKFFGEERVFAESSIPNGICAKINDMSPLDMITQIYKNLDKLLMNPDKATARRLLADECLKEKSIIIGFSGKIGTGKSTCANYLSSEYGFTLVSFAQKLKDVCGGLFGFSDFQLYKNKEQVDEYWGRSPREFLQIIGTELFRDHLPKFFAEFKDEFWVRITDRTVQKLLQNGLRLICIEDVRFPNEQQYVKKLGGKIIRIERPFELQRVQKSSRAHKTETQEIQCDLQINNSGDMQALHKQLDDIVASLL